jgi:mono/diheme cytochrome c family protein
MKSTLTAAGLALIALTAGAQAQEDAGRKEYMVACAVCHGESGKGDGPFAPILNISVPSLTGLSAANDGAFPFLEAFMMIDGRTKMRAHGSPMPVWGDRYSDSAADTYGPYGTEVVTRGRILSLVYYLESIQE